MPVAGLSASAPEEEAAQPASVSSGTLVLPPPSLPNTCSSAPGHPAAVEQGCRKQIPTRHFSKVDFTGTRWLP